MTSLRRIYDLRLEWIRTRAMRAVENTASEPREALISALDKEVTQIERTLAAMEAGRDRDLAQTLGLADDDVDFLWTAVALAGDPRIQPHAHVLVGNDARRGASLALHTTIAQLDGKRARDLALAFGPGHALLRNHVLISEDAGGGRVFTAPHRVCAHLAGDDAVDPMVAELGGVVDPPASLRWDAAQQATCARLKLALAAHDSLAIVVEGPRGVGRRTALAVAARSCGFGSVAMDVSRIAPAVPALEAALAALRRECLLLAALPIVTEIEDLWDGQAASPRLRALARVIDEMPGPVALVTSHSGLELPLRRRVLRVALSAPDTATRHDLWLQELGERAPADLDILSMRYRLGAGGIKRAVAATQVVASGRSLDVHDLIDGVRNDIADSLGGLAQRVEVKQSWEDLVLAPDTLDQVGALVARVRHSYRVLEEWGFSAKLPRGIGVAGLFSGPPGTGKTMVAGLIARELELELYQVDLSKVVSKWVGETEKQLSKIFDAAEAGHALLLFDEADSLFAKRTEVRAAVDRYANLEVNYLLQRIESFGGITLLTTNMDTAIDPALRRRLAAHVVFWAPDADERGALWKRMLPKTAPTSGKLDFVRMADAFPDMTGANIRNAAIAAAFLAASVESPITQTLLERAAKAEYRAMGRVLKEGAR